MPRKPARALVKRTDSRLDKAAGMSQRVLRKLKRRILTPKQWAGVEENTHRPWIWVESLDRMAHFLNKRNFLRQWIEEVRKLTPKAKAGDAAAKARIKELEPILSTYQRPDKILFLPTQTSQGPVVLALVGNKVTQKELRRATEARLLQTTEANMHRIAHPHHAQYLAKIEWKEIRQRRKKAQKSPHLHEILYWWLDPRTRKFLPVYTHKANIDLFGRRMH